MTSIAAPEALAGYSLMACTAAGLVIVRLLLGRRGDASALVRDARRLALPFALVAVLLGGVFAYLEPKEFAPYLVWDGVALIAFASVCALRGRWANGVVDSVAGALGVMVAVRSLSIGSADVAAGAPVFALRATTLLASSLACGVAAIVVWQELRGSTADVSVDVLTRTQSVALMVEGAVLLLWLCSPTAVLRPVVAAPDGYELVVGGVGLGIAAPFVVSLAMRDSDTRVLRHLAVLAGSLALRHGLLRLT